MRAGRLRHKVDIEQVTLSQDSFGAESERWTKLYSNIPASIEPLSGRDLFAAQQINSEITTKIKIRHSVANEGDPAPQTEVTKNWQFQSSNESFTGVRATLTVQAEYSILNATAPTPQMKHLVIAFSGAENRFVRVKVRRVVGATWRGRVYYSTSGHGFTGNYYGGMDSIDIDGDFHFIEADMHDLVIGGDDWKDNTITGVYFAFCDDADAITYVEWIQVGGDKSTYNLEVTSKNRVNFGGRIFEIISPPINFDERNREVQLMTVERV